MGGLYAGASRLIALNTKGGGGSLPPSGSTSPVIFQNTVWVAENGNAGGARNDQGKPFLSIVGAIAAASAGDCIIVLPGDYTADSYINITKQVTIWLWPGATVYALFNAAVPCKLIGGTIIPQLAPSANYTAGVQTAQNALLELEGVTINGSGVSTAFPDVALYVAGGTSAVHVKAKGCKFIANGNAVESKDVLETGSVSQWGLGQIIELDDCYAESIAEYAVQAYQNKLIAKGCYLRSSLEGISIRRGLSQAFTCMLEESKIISDAANSINITTVGLVTYQLIVRNSASNKVFPASTGITYSNIYEDLNIE